MSDELRDMLRGRADAIDVPSGDVSTVVSGGRALKARRYAFAAIASVVAVATVVWGATNRTEVFRSDAPGEVAQPGPSESEAVPTDSPAPAVECGFVPFRPGYLPDGWDYELGEGSGGQRGIPYEEQSPKALGHYTYRGSADGGGSSTPGFIDIYEYDSAPYPLISNGEAIRVLDGEGTIGDVHEGYAVDFTYEGCRYMLTANGPRKDELGRVARRLQPRDTCEGREIRTADPLPDGRHFGYITGTDGIGIEFDEAEFLSGEEANERARADGAIGPNETVPNDYYIVNDDESAIGLSVSRNVDVLLDTSSHDGTIGLARWDFNDLVCMFESRDPMDTGHFQNGYWITVEGGVVTRMEEQWVP